MLDSVSVTASKLPVPLHKNTRTVMLMDSLAIASAPAENINDLLKYALGVDVRQRGAMGMQTDISMRGGTYNQIAVLLNGIDISDPQTGHNSADFPVNLSDIDHIEVLEGPAARGHGASSMIGAINIVTKYSGESKASLNLEGGSFKYGNANGSVALKGRRSFNISLPDTSAPTASTAMPREASTTTSAPSRPSTTAMPSLPRPPFRGRPAPA